MTALPAKSYAALAEELRLALKDRDEWKKQAAALDEENSTLITEVDQLRRKLNGRA